MRVFLCDFPVHIQSYNFTLRAHIFMSIPPALIIRDEEDEYWQSAYNHNKMMRKKQHRFFIHLRGHCFAAVSTAIIVYRRYRVIKYNSNYTQDGTTLWQQ